MALTEAQREEHRKYITASDAPPIILGRTYKATRGDIYARKVWGTRDFTNPSIEMGNVMEPVLVQLLANALQRKIDYPVELQVHPNGEVAATPDGIINPEEIVEAKYQVQGEDWGEAGTDEVPPRVVIQAHAQFFVTEARICWVPAVVVPYGIELRIYRIVRDDELAEMVGTEMLRFKHEHVDARVPPEDVPAWDTVRRMHRQHGKVADLTPEQQQQIAVAADLWQQHRRTRLDATKAEEKAKAAIGYIMEDASIARFPGGCVEWVPRQRKGYTVQPTSWEELTFKETVDDGKEAAKREEAQGHETNAQQPEDGRQEHEANEEPSS